MSGVQTLFGLASLLLLADASRNYVRPLLFRRSSVEETSERNEASGIASNRPCTMPGNFLVRRHAHGGGPQKGPLHESKGTVSRLMTLGSWLEGNSVIIYKTSVLIKLKEATPCAAAAAAQKRRRASGTTSSRRRAQPRGSGTRARPLPPAAQHAPQATEESCLSTQLPIRSGTGRIKHLQVDREMQIKHICRIVWPVPCAVIYLSLTCVNSTLSLLKHTQMHFHL